MESTNIIQCPYCRNLIEPWDYVETGDMDGEFEIVCERCLEKIKVEFETIIKFKTS